MAGVRLIITMVGAVCVAALVTSGDVSARSCSDKDKANGSCPGSTSTSSPLKLFQSLLQPSPKPRPPARIHKPAGAEAVTATAAARSEAPLASATSTRTYAHPIRAIAAGRDRVRFTMREAPASPGDTVDLSTKSIAVPVQARAPQLASSKSAAVALAAPVAAPTGKVASAAGVEVASIIPSNLVEPKPSGEIGLTAGMADPSGPPAPDRSWLGGLLAVLGGALAAAAGARFVFN